ncbi:dihydropteroate synthase [Marinibaculum pumilum]|uniref:Dihydropteroate synthase n=1 Tax=Marinibaculum pumilum TaxID=1766165 RepID=A0ABV7L6N7_9PROT
MHSRTIGAPPLVMGILNVTPDSFADGGRHDAPQQAIAHGLRLAAEGADIVDVGGESTRPGAAEVPPAEEAARVVPVIRALAAEGVCVSVDTRRAAVMEQAAAAGAAILNDVSGLSFDPAAMAVAAGFPGPVVLMHMRGTPADMVRRTDYPDGVVPAVCDWARERLAACEAAGIGRERIVLDPGIGFAKTWAQSLELLAALPRLAALGRPLLVGASRKSFIGHLADAPTPDARLPGSLAAALWAATAGADILRVHDVAATRQALAVWQGISGAAVRQGVDDGDGKGKGD